jgi:hypothetical protein
LSLNICLEKRKKKLRKTTIFFKKNQSEKKGVRHHKQGHIKVNMTLCPLH